MRHLGMVLGVMALVALGWSQNAAAHCQVPCGIYDDHARIHTIREHITTVAKAVKKITALSKKADAQSKNQLVRWINTKEAHAEKIIRIVSDYFLTQKIKPVGTKKKGHAGYLLKLARHHAVMRAAMKVKQTVSGKAVSSLSKAVDGIAGYWSKKK